MPRRSAVVAALLFALAGPVRAQSPDSAASPFRQLALPAPNELRTGSGRPGRAYWQQRVDYRIGRLSIPRATSSSGARPSTTSIAPGSAPLPLGVSRAEHLRARQRHQQAEPARRSSSWAPPSISPARASPAASRSTSCDSGPARAADGVRHHDASGSPPAARRQGNSLDLDIGWRFAVPDYGAGRMGRDGTLYELGAVVSAGGGVRRRARLESRAVHRGRRVLPRVRPVRCLPHGPRRLRRRRHRHAAQSRRGAHGDPARPPDTGAHVRHPGRDHRR